ncbi:MAG: hypothetical protein P0119_09090 [Nitrospira sp.]|nr:hypothetical protein [Nitrospira sp.]
MRLLQTMEAQYARDTHRGSTSSLGPGIDRSNGGGQFRPRHGAVHLIEKSLPTR